MGENRLSRLRVVGQGLALRAPGICDPAPISYRTELVLVQPISENRNPKKHRSPARLGRAGGGEEATGSLARRGCPHGSPPAVPAAPFPHLSSSPRLRFTGSRSPTFSHRSRETTTRFGLRGHLGRGHNESGCRQAGPIGWRRMRAGEGGTCPGSRKGRGSFEARGWPEWRRRASLG